RMFREQLGGDLVDAAAAGAVGDIGSGLQPFSLDGPLLRRPVRGFRYHLPFLPLDGMMRMMRCLRLLSLLSLLLLVVACGGKRLDKTETLPVDQMYDAARMSLNNGNYDRSIRYYQRLIARFPFGLYTEQAHLELAYAQYRSK